MFINPLAVVLVALCTAVGLLLGHWLIGLAIGLAVVLLASASARR